MAEWLTSIILFNSLKNTHMLSTWELIGVIVLVAVILYFVLRKKSNSKDVKNNCNKNDNNVVVNIYNNQEPKSK